VACVIFIVKNACAITSYSPSLFGHNSLSHAQVEDNKYKLRDALQIAIPANEWGHNNQQGGRAQEKMLSFAWPFFPISKPNLTPLLSVP